MTKQGALWGTHGVLNGYSTGRQIGRSLPFVLVYSTGTRSSDSGEGDKSRGWDLRSSCFGDRRSHT